MLSSEKCIRIENIFACKLRAECRMPNARFAPTRAECKNRAECSNVANFVPNAQCKNCANFQSAECRMPKGIESVPNARTPGDEHARGHGKGEGKRKTKPGIPKRDCSDTPGPFVRPQTLVRSYPRLRRPRAARRPRGFPDDPYGER